MFQPPYELIYLRFADWRNIVRVMAIHQEPMETAKDYQATPSLRWWFKTLNRSFLIMARKMQSPYFAQFMSTKTMR